MENAVLLLLFATEKRYISVRTQMEYKFVVRLRASERR